jgi:hypothetical protein
LLWGLLEGGCEFGVEADVGVCEVHVAFQEDGSDEPTGKF